MGHTHLIITNKYIGVKIKTPTSLFLAIPGYEYLLKSCNY